MLGIRPESTCEKTIRILGVSLALLALLVFATGVVSDWNHQGSNDDAHCPYCHLGHQTPAQLVAAPSRSMLNPVASLPLPQDAVLPRALFFRKPRLARLPPLNLARLQAPFATGAIRI